MRPVRKIADLCLSLFHRHIAAAFGALAIDFAPFPVGVRFQLIVPRRESAVFAVDEKVIRENASRRNVNAV